MNGQQRLHHIGGTTTISSQKKLASVTPQDLTTSDDLIRTNYDIVIVLHDLV